jgi:hypothetical protein
MDSYLDEDSSLFFDSDRLSLVETFRNDRDLSECFQFREFVRKQHEYSEFVDSEEFVVSKDLHLQ